MSESSKQKYIVVAGSFDYLHEGHKALLKKAFSFGKKVFVGLMTDEHLAKKAENSMPIRQRKRELKDFLKRFKTPSRIVLLKDKYGSAAGSELMDTIVVSPEARITAEEINDLRGMNGLDPLRIVEVPLLRDSKGEKISSERIRKGEIDRKGKYFFNEKLFKKGKVFKVKPSSKLKEPWGPVFEGKRIVNMFNKWDKKLKVITVGDVATKTFIKSRITPDLAIVDNIVERVKLPKIKRIPFKHFNIMYKVKNEAGTITFDLMRTLDIAFKGFGNLKQVILIKGEEDLATVAAILLAPLQSKLFYGQPGEGMVQVIVNEKLKEKARKILGK